MSVRVTLLLDGGKNQKFLWVRFGLYFNERKSNPEHCILHRSALSLRRLKMKTNLEKSHTTSCLWDNFLLTRPCGCECCQFLLRYAETKILTWQKKTSSKSFSSSLIFGTSSFCPTTKIILFYASYGNAEVFGTLTAYLSKKHHSFQKLILCLSLNHYVACGLCETHGLQIPRKQLIF